MICLPAGRWRHTSTRLQHRLLTQPKAKGNVFSFDYFIKEMVNVAPVQPSNYGYIMDTLWYIMIWYDTLWIHLGGLLSNQEDRVALGNSYDSFVLSNLPRASITRWLHAARLPLTFTSCISDTSKLTISVIAPSVSSHLYFIFKVTGIRDTLGRQEIAVTPVYKRLYGQMRSWEKNINGKNNNNKYEENRKWHCISTIVSWKCFGYCWSIYRLDRLVIVFFLALLDPYWIFQIAIIIALFIYLLFFSECILPGSVFWGLWSPRNYNSLNFYIDFITRITLSQPHQFPLTNKQCSVAQLQADWTSAPNTICCLSSCFLAVLATFLTIVRRETSKMFHHYSLRKHLKLVPRSSRLKNAELLKSSVKYGKILPNLVNSSSLCWIMRVILANQKRKNILNEYRRLHLSVHTRRKNMFWLSANMKCQFPSFSLSSGWRKEERAWEGDFCHSSSCGQIGPWDKNINEKK